MSKLVASIIIGFVVIGLIVFVVTISKSAGFKEKEEAYFIGQREAINGNVCIVLNHDSTYEWIKSPWSSGRKPIYKPDRFDSRPLNGWHLYQGDYQIYLTNDSIFVFDGTRRLTAFVYDSTRLSQAILDDNR